MRLCTEDKESYRRGMRSIPPRGRECVKTRITAGPDRNLNHEDTKAQEDSLKRAAQCLSFSVFVSLWFSLPQFLIDRTSCYTVSVGRGMGVILPILTHPLPAGGCVANFDNFCRHDCYESPSIRSFSGPRSAAHPRATARWY